MFQYLTHETTLKNEDGIEIYSFIAANGEQKYGFKIFEDTSKRYLCCESAGFLTKEEAEKGVETYLAYFKEDSDVLSSQ